MKPGAIIRCEKVISFSLVFLSLLTTAACSGAYRHALSEARPGAPDWAKDSNGVVSTISGDISILGIGSIRGIENLDLGRETAEQEAQANAVKWFMSYTEMLISTFPEASKELSKEEFSKWIVGARKTFNETRIKDVAISQRHWDHQTNTWYAAVKIDHSVFDNFLLGLDAPEFIKQFIRENSRTTWLSLEK